MIDSCGATAQTPQHYLMEVCQSSPPAGSAGSQALAQLAHAILQPGMEGRRRRGKEGGEEGREEEREGGRILLYLLLLRPIL